MIIMVLVCTIVAFIIYLFVTHKKEEVDKIKNQGGIYFKYKELIDYFLTIPDIQVEKKNSYSITLLVRGAGVETRFIIGHGFEDVSIFWNHKSIMFGIHSLNWKFPEYQSQSQMISTIERELEIYQKNLL
jgi:hypothetical protein